MFSRLTKFSFLLHTGWMYHESLNGFFLDKGGKRSIFLDAFFLKLI